MRSTMLLASTLLANAAAVTAQAPPAPPAVLNVERVTLKPGQAGPYQEIMEGNAAAKKQAGWRRITIAMRSVSGPDEILYLTGYSDRAEWDADRAQMEQNPLLKFSLSENDRRAGQYASDIVTGSLTYRPAISFRPNFIWSDMKCMDLISVQLKAGHGDEYLQNREIVVKAHTGADVHEHLALYITASGVQSSTFFVLRPLTSLHEMDLLDAEHDSEKYGTALGDANRAKLHSLFAASVDKEEERFYCAVPELSYVTPEWVQTNKDFWMRQKK